MQQYQQLEGRIRQKAHICLHKYIDIHIWMQYVYTYIHTLHVQTYFKIVTIAGSLFSLLAKIPKVVLLRYSFFLADSSGIFAIFANHIIQGF